MDCGPAKILLVDDVAENLIALEALLQDPAHETFSATNANAALEMMLKHEFALAVIDVQMPDMNGFELAQVMRSTERTRQIPIIFVTAGSTKPDNVLTGYQSGAIDFMIKPLDTYAVLSKVRIFVELYQQKLALNQQVAALEEARHQQNLLLEQLQKTQVELEKAMELRDQFISVVAHELRTPLNTLNLELYARRTYLERGDYVEFSPERIAEMVESDERQLKRLIRLINDMTDLSRIKSGQLSIQRKRFDITALLHRVINLFSAQTALAKCAVNFKGEPGIVISADEFRIEQAFTNLLTNAIRHCDGKPIEIQVQELAGMVSISVRDFGLGIKSEEQQRIFKLFERGSHERPGSGLGLGLFIANTIVAAHDGRIEVDSTPGEGAMFTIFLPK
ncbi:MAG: hybrid sensor histidine kinase/response regulator [Gammaproteobacteria bacterium]|nr:hybrid sensor histidine kinase/response regulator [Gammaproteobacteria bacterium]